MTEKNSGQNEDQKKPTPPPEKEPAKKPKPGSSDFVIKWETGNPHRRGK